MRRGREGGREEGRGERERGERGERGERERERERERESGMTWLPRGLSALST